MERASECKYNCWKFKLWKLKIQIEHLYWTACLIKASQNTALVGDCLRSCPGEKPLWQRNWPKWQGPHQVIVNPLLAFKLQFVSFFYCCCCYQQDSDSVYRTHCVLWSRKREMKISWSKVSIYKFMNGAVQCPCHWPQRHQNKSLINTCFKIIKMP